MKRTRIFLFILLYLCFFSIVDVRADSPLEEDVKEMKVQMAVMQQKVATLEEKVSDQQNKITNDEATKQAYEQRINDLESQLAKQQQTAPANTVSQNRPAVGKWTPEIGVVADTVLKLDSSKEDIEGNNRLSLRELELVLGSAVDPFSRLDATISFSDSEAPSLEEAYLTRFGLPWDMTARIGKFKPKVGKVLGAHRDSLDTVNEPLVIQRYFGVEGMNKSGVDFYKTLDFPWPVTQQVAFGILEGGNGDGGTAFGTTRRSPTLYSHLKNYLDINDTTGFELGFSHIIGSRDKNPGFESQILATDITLTKNLGANQSLKLQTEAFNLNRRKTEGADGNLWGAYGLLDFRFHPQWSAGLRYDCAQLVDNPVDNPHNADLGETGDLTFYQSELARWRLQYSHTKLATGKDDNTVYLQGTFAIGEHKHKLQ